MPQADADLPLSTLAAALGELEPPDENDNMEGAHCGRIHALQAAASFLSVRSAVDAALALSLVAEIHGDVCCNECSEDGRKSGSPAAPPFSRIPRDGSRSVRWLPTVPHFPVSETLVSLSVFRASRR